MRIGDAVAPGRATASGTRWAGPASGVITIQPPATPTAAAGGDAHRHRQRRDGVGREHEPGRLDRGGEAGGVARGVALQAEASVRAASVRFSTVEPAVRHAVAAGRAERERGRTRPDGRGRRGGGVGAAAALGLHGRERRVERRAPARPSRSAPSAAARRSSRGAAAASTATRPAACAAATLVPETARVAAARLGADDRDAGQHEVGLQAVVPAEALRRERRDGVAQRVGA